MHVEALDHVNIIVGDLMRSAAFYRDVIGLEERDAPPPLTPLTARWMYDGGAHAVLHLNSADAPRAYPRDVTPGPTGSVHHVALRCRGYAAMVARLEESGAAYQSNLIAAIGLKQLFLTDPDGVLLELNYFAD